MLIKSLTKVDKLTKRVENLYDQREVDELRNERDQARLKIINDATDITKTDFWCNEHGDTSGMAYKIVFKDRDLGLCAYYESFGRNFWPNEITACCKRLRRRITDKQNDPYFRDSAMIQKQAREARDKGWLLQPGQDGFNTKYGDPNKKKYEQMEREDKANWTKKIMI